MQAQAASQDTWIAGLARFAHGFRLSDASPTVREQAKLAVLDTIGCILAGAGDPDVEKLATAERAIDPREEVWVPGLRQRFAPEAAARISAYMGDLFEWNDLIGGHASIACLPAVLSLVGRQKPGGTELLEAYIVGAEITAAIYEATSVEPNAGSTVNYRKPYDEVSVGPVSVPSSIGAAASASRMLGLTEAQTQHAMAASVVLAAYSAAEGVFGAAGSIKPLLFGPWPAFIGMRSAFYAQAGLTGALRVLESDIGFFKTVSYAGHPVPVAGGDFWRLENPRRKYHANCGFIHSGIDALIKLRRRGVDLAGASEIRVAVPEDVKLLVSKPSPPSRAGDALFHGEYNLALAALEVDMILPAHSLAFADYLARDDFRSMLGKVKMVDAAGLTHSICSEVTIFDGDGAVIASERNDMPKGSYTNPMTAEEVKEKFRTCARTFLDDRAIEAFIARVGELDRQEDCEWLASSFN